MSAAESRLVRDGSRIVLVFCTLNWEHTVSTSVMRILANFTLLAPKEIDQHKVLQKRDWLGECEYWLG
jgi:hypothetical protein